MVDQFAISCGSRNKEGRAENDFKMLGRIGDPQLALTEQNVALWGRHGYDLKSTGTSNREQTNQDMLQQAVCSHLPISAIVVFHSDQPEPLLFYPLEMNGYIRHRVRHITSTLGQPSSTTGQPSTIPPLEPSSTTRA